jgi:NAD(P)-dependent dehydrogenase (short-subunit alcohol dehydrogenase family)
LTSTSPWREWRGEAVVVGRGGIGGALMEDLANRAPGLTVLSAGRRDCDLPLDLRDDTSLQSFGAAIKAMGSLRIVIHTAGLLHDDDLQPEKRLSQIRREWLERSFCVNAWSPVLVAQAIEPALPRDQPVHFASLSARVGSISDNHLGGWYSYRAAKAAQNQLLKTLALEWRRRLPLACVTLLHPGTTATPLSAPFRGGVPAEKLFSPERAAGHLLDVLQGQDPNPQRQLPGLGRNPIPW